MSGTWKTPDEIIRLQRLKQRTKALQARLDRPAAKKASANAAATTDGDAADAPKRKNPFADKLQTTAKRHKSTDQAPPSSSLPSAAGADAAHFDTGTSDDSIFQILSAAQQRTPASAADEDRSAASKPPDDTTTTSATSHQQLPANFQQFIIPDVNGGDSDSDGEQQAPTAHVPLDWGLKTKLRLLTLSRLCGNGLKTCQEASGITGFVRCLDVTATAEAAGGGLGLDSSLGARFHAATMYWQHPHVPWLQLWPRQQRASADFAFGEREREALARDWTEAFRALFQLLRARQCAYFYVCANTYTVLFCAAGVGGRDEQHAWLTPTSRGMRAALKQEEIEFAMPLKEAVASAGSKQNKSLDSGVATDASQNASFSNGSDECNGGGAATATQDGAGEEDDDDDSDEDQDAWLASMGVEAAEIRRIGSRDARAARNAECADDFSDHSIALIEGVECQAFFNFLLHSKSTITKTGRLAGVPPTLLAPVAFPGATLRSVQTRASQIRMDGVEYHSLELRGVVLPHVMPYLCGLMRESKDTFSASMTGNAATSAFSRAAQRVMEDKHREQQTKSAGGKASTDPGVFGRENLSDCGMPPAILEAMCRSAPDAVRSLERMCFNKEVGGYTWN